MTRVESFLSEIAAAINGLVRIASGLVWVDGAAKGALGVVVLATAFGVAGYAYGIARRNKG